MGMEICCKSQNKENIPDNNNNNENQSKSTKPKSSIQSDISSFEFNKSKLINYSQGNPDNSYIYLVKIGEGSYGSVFKVRHRDTGIIRAIKMIKKPTKTYSQWLNEDILKEIELLKSLDHQNILKIIEIYESDIFVYIVTEYCKGTDLYTKIQREKSFNETTTGIIMFQLFSAINYCHSKHIMHRDLKPENIMIEENTIDGYLQIKIIDFGTATFYQKDNLNKLIGSPYYIAPEVIDKNYNEECDLWSLGVIMYVMLRGNYPFKGNDIESTFKLIKEGKYVLDSYPFNNISDDAKDLIKRLLIVDPTMRIPACDALNHPFFIKNRVKEKLSYLSTEDIQTMLKNVMKYNPDKILQQAVMAYLVMHNQDMPQVHKANCLFSKIDLNNDGHISQPEFLTGINSLFLERNQRGDNFFLKKLFDIIDADHSGDIENEEFIRAAIDKSAFLDEKVLKNAFDFFDKDKSGGITLDEINEVFNKMHQYNEEDFKVVISEVDINNDGLIDFNEFCQMMNAILK